VGLAEVSLARDKKLARSRDDSRVRRRLWLIEWPRAEAVIGRGSEAGRRSVIQCECIDGLLAEFGVELEVEAVGEERLHHQAELILA
jgi:hypothetical protein